MIQKFRHSIAFILVAALLLPSMLRLEHHHERFSCNAKTEKHIHEYHKECAACNFTFSVFLDDFQKISSNKHETLDSYINLFKSCIYSNRHSYSFLLRGPPAYTIS